MSYPAGDQFSVLRSQPHPPQLSAVDVLKTLGLAMRSSMPGIVGLQKEKPNWLCPPRSLKTLQIVGNRVLTSLPVFSFAIFPSLKI